MNGKAGREIARCSSYGCSVYQAVAGWVKDPFNHWISITFRLTRELPSFEKFRKGLRTRKSIQIEKGEEGLSC
jgi:hypothetical protein